MTKNILISGGAGFIGTHVVKHFVHQYADYSIYNLDALTYAGNLENLKNLQVKENYNFLKGNISDLSYIRKIFATYQFDSVIHLAAESHVDRSIEDPLLFVKTNVLGTATLLQVAKENWENNFDGKLFYHVSTDEVFGSLTLDKTYFTEKTPYDPKSPYSASKASSDHLVRAWHHTFGLPVILSNCSNNYGPYQFPEKLIPLFINNILNHKELPVYGKGINIRDWLYVEDHAKAIDKIFHHGKLGETYNIGGHNEWRNIDLIKLLCELMDQKLGREKGASEKLIAFVSDRLGHDLRYAIDATKLGEELKWQPSLQFKEGLSKTIDWYLDNQNWLNKVTSGKYKEYYQKMYGN